MTNKALQIQQTNLITPPSRLPVTAEWRRDEPKEIALVINGIPVHDVREVQATLTTYGGATVTIRRLTTPIGGIQEDVYLRLTNPESIRIEAVGVLDGCK